MFRLDSAFHHSRCCSWIGGGCLICIGIAWGQVSEVEQWNEAEIDESLQLESYEVKRGIWGMLRLAGSDIPEEFLTPMLKRFQQYYPFVRAEFDRSTSRAAPRALLAGKADVGLMSRRMRAEDLAALEQTWGSRPASVRLCMDALAVVTHSENPVRYLTADDLQKIFARPGKEDPAWVRPGTWGDVDSGLGRWGQRELQPYGRTEDSGTRKVFEEMVLGGRTFADEGMRLYASTQELMLAVRADRSAIAYASRSVLAPGLKIVPLRGSEGRTVSPLDDERCRTVSYPYVRFIYAYFERPKDEPVAAVVEEFLRYAFSREGQTLVKRAGFIPLPAAQGQTLVEELLGGDR